MFAGIKKRYLYIAISLAFLFPYAATAIETIHPNGREFIDLTAVMEALHDPGGQATLRDVRASGAFRRVDGKTPNFGLSSGSAWSRVRIDLNGNDQKERWVFVWDLTFIDTADVYVVGDDGTELAHDRMGILVGPPNKNMIYYWSDLSKIENKSYTIYARNTSRYPLRVNALLMTESENGRRESKLSLFYGLLSGSEVVISILFLCFIIILKKIEYVFGFFLSLSMLWFNLMISGVNRPLGLAFFPKDDWFFTQIPIFGINIFLPLLVAQFCETPTHWPSAYRKGVATGIAITGLQIIFLFYNQNLSLLIETIILLCDFLLVAAIIFLDNKTKNDERFTVVIAISPFIICSTIHVVAFNDWIPGLIPFVGIYQHFLDIGYVLLLIGFVIAGVHRTRYRLEAIVSDRTKQLVAANKEVQHSLIAEQSARQQMHSFIQMATHEFKTPLATIDSAAQVIELRLGAAVNDVSNRVLVIRNAVKRIIELINVCLDGERYEALSAKFSRFAPSSLIQRISDRVLMQGRNPLLVTTSNLPAECYADFSLLEIALEALLDNAYRYAPEHPVELDIGVENKMIAFAVCDRGTGVPDEEVAFIFEKYYRGSKHTTISGTGIGLHLVKVVAELHRGTVSYQARSGGGAVFKLTVPLS